MRQTPLPTFTPDVQRQLEKALPGELTEKHFRKAYQETAEYYLCLFPDIDGYGNTFGYIAEQLFKQYPALGTGGTTPWVSKIVLV